MQNEWVISRVFQKSSSSNSGGVGGGRKGIGVMGRGGEDETIVVGSGSPLLPPLLDMTYSNNSSKAHVTCFSNGLEGQKGHEDFLTEDLNPLLLSSTANPSSVTNPYSSKLPLQLIHYNTTTTNNNNSNSNSNINGLQFYQTAGGGGGSSSSLVQLLESNGYYGMKGSCKTERDQMLSISQETGLTSDINPEISSVAQEVPSSSAAHLPLHDYIWSYE